MHNNPLISRRVLLAAPALALALSALPKPSSALTNAEATNLISRLVTDLNRIINSGEPRKAMYRDFEKLFAKYADVYIIARSALGFAWRSATASQRTRYTAAFRGYMARKYGNRFREFIGGKIVVTGTRKVKSGYLVASTAYLKGSSPFSVDWQVSDKSGKNKMFNIYIEGISLLASERIAIGAMLDRRGGNLDLLIKDLRTAS